MAASYVFLEWLETTRFRNLLSINLPFSAPLNIFYGDNAQGKTNLLEAIGLITSWRSLRPTRSRDLICFGEQSARVRGSLRTAIGCREIEVTLSDAPKRVRVDGKAMSSLEKLGDEVKVVLFTPDDLSVLRGPPSGRRSYLDGIILQLFPRYKSYVKDYAHAIAQKNQLLSHEGDYGPTMLDIWNERIVEAGSKLIVARRRLVGKMSAAFRETYREISGTDVVADLKYVGNICGDARLEGKELRRQYTQALLDLADEERRQRRALAGPHRDDLEVTLNGRSASSFGSQGQIRLLSVGLKLLELRVLVEERGIVPVFLIDDVSSELDEHRNLYLMNYLARVGCQVFITTTSLNNVHSDAFSDVSRFRIVDGKIRNDLST